MALTYGGRCYCLLQIKEGTNLPTTYAFGLVEHTQGNLLRLKMYLGGEFMQVNKDAVKSQRLLNMRSLITSTVSAENKHLYSLKVICCLPILL